MSRIHLCDCSGVEMILSPHFILDVASQHCSIDQAILQTEFVSKNVDKINIIISAIERVKDQKKKNDKNDTHTNTHEK
jgi:hypothetical protein